jgi:hypothetical protein
LFTIFLAIKRCRIAQARMYSGTSSAHMNSTNLFLKKHDILWTHLGQRSMYCVSTGSGRLGWIATHVHKNIVVMQLHIMSSRVLQLSISLHEDDVLDMDISRAGTGRARAESCEWMKKRKSIMQRPSCIPWGLYIIDSCCSVSCACSCHPRVRLVPRLLSMSGASRWRNL